MSTHSRLYYPVLLLQIASKWDAAEYVRSVPNASKKVSTSGDQDYSADDLEQHAAPSQADGAGADDPRTQFRHDHDRVLYSTAFAALAGKSQVVSSGETGQFHTRLTHSLKVEQVGRRLAEKFQQQGGGPDPDLVSTACLAHDLGHPPFGHAGEQALDQKMHKLGDAKTLDGFEGNAQNLRILTHLEAHKRPTKGLHLSRAALDASTKYPWARNDDTRKFSTQYHQGEGIDRSRKFGFYATEASAGAWILNGRTVADRPIEEQIMDWADDVTYACHDLMDFYRAGAIPLDRLLAFDDEVTEGNVKPDRASEDLNQFLASVEAKFAAKGRPFEQGAALASFVRLQEILRINAPSGDSFDQKVQISSANSRLITALLNGADLNIIDPDRPPTRYNATLQVPDDLHLMCDLLKELIWKYVIDHPRLATQQQGQQRIVTELLTWYFESAERLLPVDRRDDLEDEPRLRVCVDHVSSLTELQAVNLHRRMSGVDLGAFSDSV